MQKLFYVLFDDANADGEKLREVMLGRWLPVLRASGAEDIRLLVSDQAVSAGRPIRQHDPPIRSAVSFWLADLNDRAAAETAFAEIGHDNMAGFLVRETRRLDYQRHKGQRTPGMKQLACVTKCEGLSTDEFLRIWHEEHSQVAIETQSTFGYVLNEIVRDLTTNGPGHWTAIVEESFPIEALDDPMVFYAAKSEVELAEKQKRLMKSCRRFLDLGQIDVTFLSEYIFG
jgi:hypothetical protein